MQTIAKDPIDFIRNFRFGIFKQNTGSTAGPRREDRTLIIRIVDAVYSVAVEVNVIPANHKAGKVIADWLEKQPLFFVQPYAHVIEQEGEGSTLLMVSINSFDPKPTVIKDHLDSIISRIEQTRLMMDAGNTKCMRPSYEPKPIDPRGPNNGGPGFGGAQPGQIIGTVILNDPRTPVSNNGYAPSGGILGNNKSTVGNNDW